MTDPLDEARLAEIRARWAVGTGSAGPKKWPLPVMMGGIAAREDIPYLLSLIDDRAHAGAKDIAAC